MITELKNNEIFVFGSNLAGKHAGGAAQTAHQLFGAEWGVGEGMTGRSYAYPTLDEKLQQLPKQRLVDSVARLYEACNLAPDKTFLLTRVGCGIAGYSEQFMIGVFGTQVTPRNLIKPNGW